MSDLLTCYRFHRQADCTPRGALAFARQDVAAGRDRYPSIHPALNPRHEAYGARHARWVEDPEGYGFRFVGFSDKVAPRRVDHKGWFLDENGFPDEVARGAVYRMPSRRGKPSFVPGIPDPFNNGPAWLALDHTTDCESDAASWADDFAQRYAEQEREHRAASTAGCEFVEAGEELEESRRGIRALLAEMKPRRGACFDLPAIATVLRERLADMLESRAELHAKRATLLDRFGRDESFRHAAGLNA